MSDSDGVTADDHPTQKLEIDLQIEIEATPARIWSIVATSEGMKRWQGATIFEPRVGGTVRFELGPSGNLPDGGKVAYVMADRVVRVEPERAIAYTWRQRPVGGEAWPEETLVTVTLEPLGEGTLVRVVHSGFEKLPGELAAAAHRDYSQGWEQHDDLGKLKRLAEEGR